MRKLVTTKPYQPKFKGPCENLRVSHLTDTGIPIWMDNQHKRGILWSKLGLDSVTKLTYNGPSRTNGRPSRLSGSIQQERGTAMMLTPIQILIHKNRIDEFVKRKITLVESFEKA